jgi:two-component system, LytTR family, response regulator
MQNINALIIDDEKLAREELSFLLRDIPGISIVGEAQYVREAKAMIGEYKPDLIFLDINMPVQSGFELLEELEEPPQVIFVTAYDHFAVQAFETDAMAYLVKPVVPEKLRKAVEKVRTLLETTTTIIHREKAFHADSRVFIKDGERCYMLPVHEIFLIEAVNNYCKVYFRNLSPLLHRSLQQLEEKLPPDLFFRANRKQLINVQYITRIDSYYKGGMVTEINNKYNVEISQRQSVLFKDRLSL